MSDPQKAGHEVYATMQALIASHFPLLAGIDDQILIVFKDKATKSGEVVIAGKTSKASPLLGVVSETAYLFVITLASDHWQTLTDAQREALLFHHLAACSVVEDPEDGSLVCSVRVPDVSFFREEVEHYGFWRTSGAVPEADIIQDLFGDKPDLEALAEAARAKKAAQIAARKGSRKVP